MAAQRPAVLEALKSVLIANVPLANSRVQLPWDDQLDPADGMLLDIIIDDSGVDPAAVMGKWRHQVPVKIAAVRAGAYDHRAVWNLLAEVSEAITFHYSLDGAAESVEFVTCADSVEKGGTKYLLPHVQLTIYYLTSRGSL